VVGSRLLTIVWIDFHCFDVVCCLFVSSEEVLLRARAYDLLTSAHQLDADENEVRRSSLSARICSECERNMLLAKKYLETCEWQTAIQCLDYCVQLQPDNEQYIQLLQKAKRRYQRTIVHRQSNACAQTNYKTNIQNVQTNIHVQKNRKTCRSCF
jgi:hypothetical protein